MYGCMHARAEVSRIFLFFKVTDVTCNSASHSKAIMVGARCGVKAQVSHRQDAMTHQASQPLARVGQH